MHTATAAAAAAALVTVLAATVQGGGPYGLAKTPAMGWRSWNCYHGNIDQGKMEGIMDKLSQRNRTVDGKNTSLADLGYVIAGLDDNWQACGKGVNGSFHDAAGNALVNTDRFPSMKNMTAYAHARGLKAGFYANNCICNEKDFTDPAFIESVYVQMVKQVVAWEFDGIKLDGCSQFHNTSRWSALMNASGRPIVVENCHNTNQPRNISEWGGQCPFNWFRSSTDINPSWHSIYSNLQTTTAYQGSPPLSRPGCWAYPVLEVGNMASYAEDRAHFGAWCIVSSPLILGLDLVDENKTSSVWDIITNTEAIAVNQQWAGHPGMLVKEIPAAGVNETAIEADTCQAGVQSQTGWSYDASTLAIRSPNHLCVASSGRSLALARCDSSQAAQQFQRPTSDAYGHFQQGSACMDVYDMHGPVVQLYGCHNGTNQLFKVTPDGTIADLDNKCLSIGTTAGQGLQLWAKPQPGGKVAAFVLSNRALGEPSQSVTISFAELNITAAHVQARDLWQHKELGSFSQSLTTGPIAPHDSRFYLLTPTAAD